MPGKILRAAFRNRAFLRGLSGLIDFSAAVGSDGVLTPSRTAAIWIETKFLIFVNTSAARAVPHH